VRLCNRHGLAKVKQLRAKYQAGKYRVKRYQWVNVLVPSELHIGVGEAWVYMLVWPTDSMLHVVHSRFGLTHAPWYGSLRMILNVCFQVSNDWTPAFNVLMYFKKSFLMIPFNGLWKLKLNHRNRLQKHQPSVRFAILPYKINITLLKQSRFSNVSKNRGSLKFKMFRINRFHGVHKNLKFFFSFYLYIISYFLWFKMNRSREKFFFFDWWTMFGFCALHTKCPLI
jgi:hypothetical protein